MTPAQLAYRNNLIRPVKAGKPSPREAKQHSKEHQLRALELAARANQKRRLAILEEYNRQAERA